MRLIACALLAAALAAVPADARAAEFSAADAPCYAPGQAATFKGSGWTPGAAWTLSGGVDATTTVDTGGLVAAAGTVPTPSASRRTPQTFTLSATDGTQTATSDLLVVNPGAMWNDKGRPTGRVKWSFGYLPPAETAYVLVRRGARTIATTRIGKAQGPCGTATKRLRRLPVKPSQVRNGTYKVVVSSAKRFSAASALYTYAYTVRTTYRYR